MALLIWLSPRVRLSADWYQKTIPPHVLAIADEVIE
jgi:hypothetical protein